MVWLDISQFSHSDTWKESNLPGHDSSRKNANKALPNFCMENNLKNKQKSFQEHQNNFLQTRNLKV